MLNDILPRQFMVKAILRELSRSNDLFQRGQLEIAASRVADAIEVAADIFGSNDDAAPIPEPIQRRMREDITRIREQAGTPSSPEDLGVVDAQLIPAPRNTMRFPQPVDHIEEKPKPSLLIMPGTREAAEVMREYEEREIAPIRPKRAAPAEGENIGEVPSWEFQDLYTQIMVKTPDSIKIQPQGTTTEITLDRSFNANQGTGIIKVSYTVSGQRDSTPSPTGASPDVPMAIPVEIGHTFSVYDKKGIDFAGTVEDIKDRAKSAFRPRTKDIVSATRITNETLSTVLSSALRASDEAVRKANAEGAPLPKTATFDFV